VQSLACHPNYKEERKKKNEKESRQDLAASLWYYRPSQPFTHFALFDFSITHARAVLTRPETIRVRTSEGWWL
jgi:hypothetical protein